MHRTFEKEGRVLKHIDMRDYGDGHLNAILSALQFQHRLFLREMNGELLSPEIPLIDVHTVLDFICGPGAWCVDFSKGYPDKQIYGLDCNQRIIAVAQESVACAHMDRLEFRLAKRTPPLLFDDETFDLIHLQNGTSFFTLEEWPGIIAEMYRLLKPGGWLNLVDFEMGPVSSPALDRVMGLLGQILVRLNRSIAPGGVLPFNGCTLGPQRLVRQSFTRVGYHLYPVNLGGWNNPIGRAYLHSIVARPEMIVRLAVETGLATAEELRPLLRGMRRELGQIGLCATGMLVSSFGQKPLIESRSEQWNLTAKSGRIPMSPN